MNTPLSREELDAMIAAALLEADDTVRTAWARICVEPNRWRCSPWGDESGGFWVVAVRGREAIWYNEIEEGFNTSPFRRVGTIDVYGCNQTDFSEYLRSLPEAEAAENHAAAREDREVPASLRQGGTIVARQTTYWTVVTAAEGAWRIHFTGKAEMRFAEARCSWVQIVDAHPVLENHDTAWAQLYVASAARDPAGVTVEISDRVGAATGGWRSFDSYATPGVLSAGYGSLMRAPERLVSVASEVLDEHAIRHSTIGGKPPNDPHRLLLLGRSFVVARAFRFERQLR